MVTQSLEEIIPNVLDPPAPEWSECDSEAWGRVGMDREGAKAGEGSFKGSSVGGASTLKAL